MSIAYRNVDRATTSLVAVAGPLVAVMMVLSGEPWAAAGALTAGCVAIRRVGRS